MNFSSTVPSREPGIAAEGESEVCPEGNGLKPLAAGADLQERLPLGAEGGEFVAGIRREIASIFSGEDDRLVVVVGPCSIHDPTAALDYAERLSKVARSYADDLLIVMRAYFEKPRTVAGWKGYLNDPRLDGSFDINEGVFRARELLLAMTELGVPAGTEFLDPILGQYYADLISWGVIGARTVESQIHREFASGLSMPVGFKNRTDGEVMVAVDAIRSARLAHRFPTLSHGGELVVRSTTGNSRTHVVLRGGTRGANYSASGVRAAVALLQEHGLAPHLMVDCSHANSGKDPLRQPAIASALAAQLREGERALAGVMFESNLVGGSQDPAGKPLVYGQSITDGCLAWSATVPVFDELSLGVRARRRPRQAPRPAGIVAASAPAGDAAKSVGSQGLSSDTSRDGKKEERLRVLVADDEVLARTRLLALLPKNVDVIGEYGTGTEALEAIRRDRPDIVFLDMHMPGCDGLEVVAGLDYAQRPAVVFVTAFGQFAVDAFGIRAADYVLKPFDRERLQTALERASEFVRARRAGILDAGDAGAANGAGQSREVDRPTLASPTQGFGTARRADT
jgi:3-deoxy-7-phosphoheptulonate synthase